MKNFLHAVFLLGVLLTMLCASCGGGGANGSPGETPSPSSGFGDLAIRVEWPDRTRTTYASESVVVGVFRNGAEVGRILIARPTASLQSEATLAGLPSGTLEVRLAARPNQDGTGVDQAVGTQSVTVIRGATASIVAATVSTVRSLTLLSVTVAEGATSAPAIEARNDAGELVLVDPRDVGLTVSNARAELVDGVIRGRSYGSARLTASGTFGAASALLNVLPTDESKPIVVRLLVLNYDPFVPSEGRRKLHEVLPGYIDPRRILDGYIEDLRRESRGHVRFEIVEWRDIDEIPAYEDGFRYTPDEYVALARTNGANWHQPKVMGLERILSDAGAPARISSGEIDEVVVFGDHDYGIPESAMAGPGAWFINGPVLPNVPSSRPFAIMTFSFARRTAESLHNLGHRTEDTGQKFFGAWNLKSPATPFDRFSTYRKESGGLSGIGTCHFPANGTEGYDYANPDSVVSSAPAWLEYPRATGATANVNRNDWSSPHTEQLADGTFSNSIDYQRNYLCWYYRHLPSAPGVTDGKLNDWWRYLFEFYRWTDHYER